VANAELKLLDIGSSHRLLSRQSKVRDGTYRKHTQGKKEKKGKPLTPVRRFGLSALRVDSVDNKKTQGHRQRAVGGQRPLGHPDSSRGHDRAGVMKNGWLGNVKPGLVAWL